jgi:hypothetical protein
LPGFVFLGNGLAGHSAVEAIKMLATRTEQWVNFDRQEFPIWEAILVNTDAPNWFSHF